MMYNQYFGRSAYSTFIPVSFERFFSRFFPFGGRTSSAVFFSVLSQLIANVNTSTFNRATLSIFELGFDYEILFATNFTSGLMSFCLAIASTLGTAILALALIILQYTKFLAAFFAGNGSMTTSIVTLFRAILTPIWSIIFSGYFVSKFFSAMFTNERFPVFRFSPFPHAFSRTKTAMVGIDFSLPRNKTVWLFKRTLAMFTYDNHNKNPLLSDWLFYLETASTNKGQDYFTTLLPISTVSRYQYYTTKGGVISPRQQQ